MTPTMRALPPDSEPDAPRVYGVGELADEIRSLLEEAIGVVRVRGEISGYKIVASGHHYFQLKDERAQIEIALFKGHAARLKSPLANGMAVEVEGELTAYGPRSQYQIVATRVTPTGYGALQAQFDALRRKLEAEGLFDPARRRPLPRYPTRVGLVTSLSGAAVRDMLRVIRARAPYAEVTIAPVRVQGEGAAEEIAAALDLMNEWGRAEVIIVGRGGGSPQDLWAFNEEPVARALARSRIPTVSAVGHETDVTLADLAADQRAATPTHAAQMVVKDTAEIRTALAELTKHARQRLKMQIAHATSDLRALRDHHALREPQRRLAHGHQSLDHAGLRLARALESFAAARRGRLDLAGSRLRAHTPDQSLRRARDRVDALGNQALAAFDFRRRGLAERVRERARLLDAFDYRRVLRRGYALVWGEGGAGLIHRGRSLRPDQPVEVQFHDARAAARITRVAATAEEDPT